jgi:hypothetical protein
MSAEEDPFGDDGIVANGTDTNDTGTNSTAEEEEDVDKPPLPPWYLPNAAPAVAMFLTLTSHALFHLCCHWMVWFKAAALFVPTKKVFDGCYLQVTPREHRGQSDMVKVSKSRLTGRLGFMFQRQRYEYFASTDPEYSKLNQELLVGPDEAAAEGAVQLIPCTVLLSFQQKFKLEDAIGSHACSLQPARLKRASV